MKKRENFICRPGQETLCSLRHGSHVSGLGRGYPPLDLCQAVPGTRASTMERHCAMGFRNRYFDDAFRNLCRYPFFSDSPEKMHHTGTPYRKRLFRWHHLAGLCFGLFTLTWIFSGFMSLAQVPQWISKVHEPRNVRDEINGSSLALDAYRLDCQRILEQEGIKNLTWTSLGGYPCYKVETEKETYLVDATIPSEVRRLEVDETFCREMMQHILGKRGSCRSLFADRI